MKRCIAAVPDFFMSLLFRVGGFIFSVPREPLSEYTVYLFISAMRKVMPSAFSGLAETLASIGQGEEITPGDIALDIDERLAADEHELYISATKLMNSDTFSHFFTERILAKFIESCSLSENKKIYPQVYIECSMPSIARIPDVVQADDLFARYFRRAFSKKPHLYYHVFQAKYDFSRIFFKKDELLQYLAQVPTIKRAFYLYLVRNTEVLRGIGKELFARASLEKLKALLPNYSKDSKAHKDLRALILTIEGNTYPEIAAKLFIANASDVSKRFKPAMDIAFQYNIFQLEWLLRARKRKASTDKNKKCDNS